MTRIRFQNLPSTNTPVSAENLNKLNNVVISSTEPTTGEEVWLEKGKNLFNGILRNVAISSTTGEETISTTIKSSEYINVNSSTNYTMSTNETEHKYYYYYYNENKYFISTGSSGYDINSHTFTTPQNCKYIRFSLSSPTSTQIQLEQGSSATTYEAYKPKKIYIKKDNGNYELFTETVSKDEELVVGSIRSKNMFGNYVIINGWIDNGIARIYTSNTERIAFVACKPNTTYTISKTPVSSRFRVGNYTTIPAMTATATDYTIGTIIKNDSGTKITYTTNATAKYLLIQYSQTNEDSANLIQQILNTMQVEEGSEATNYMPYQQIETVIENFADKVAFASGEEAAAGLFRKIGNQIIIMYQGPNKTHSGETLLFTLPEAYRPKSLIVAPYTKWASAYGQIIIYDNGQCKIGNISSTSATGRVAFNVTYTTD